MLRGVVIATALGALVPACRHSTSAAASEAPVDRSDGTIPSLNAPHIAANRIHIDGRLDEPEWQHAGSTGGLVNPGDGSPAPDSHVQASAKFLWDDANLYVGAVVNDRDPTSPFQPTDVDPHIWERSSAIELMVQPGDPGDNRNYYEIQVDVNGAIWDTHFDDYNQPITEGPFPGARRFGHQEWTSNVQKAVAIDRAAGRYTIEMALPWASLESARTAVPPHAGDAWRINVYSFRDGQRDALAWSPIRGEGNFHRATRWGRVIFAR